MANRVYLCSSNAKFFLMILPDIENFYKAVGERIKTERLKREISQKSLGQYLDLTRASVINLEKGRHRPSIYQLIQIANFFKINYNVLIPFGSPKTKGKKKMVLSDLKNIVTDQVMDKTTRTAVSSFLTALKSKES